MSEYSVGQEVERQTLGSVDKVFKRCLRSKRRRVEYFSVALWFFCWNRRPSKPARCRTGERERQKTAAQLVNRYGRIENFPANTLGANLESALLFKNLATLRTDLPLFTDIEDLRWKGPTTGFPAWAERQGDGRLLTRVEELKAS
jgi:hypothetical protein